MKNKVQLFIAGDFVPTKSNEKMFINGKLEELVGENINEMFETSDFNILNLETPLIKKKTPIEKCGPNLGADVRCINAISKIDNCVLSLANNHIMDHGNIGFDKTISVLNKNNIKWFGVGENKEKLVKHIILEKDNLKIGLYSCAETEFSIATEESAGANPYDDYQSLLDIKLLKDKCDFVIVLYHGGKEHYRYPSPLLQERCQHMIDFGVDLVVCQHSHCVGCKEDYNSGNIIYGQGNFLFDHQNNEYWQTGLLLNIVIEDKKLKVIEIPIRKVNEVVRLATDDEKKKILDGYQIRSENIKQEGFIEQQYNFFASQYIDGYLNTYLGSSFFVRVINRLLNRKLMNFVLSKKNLLAILNHIECEAHRELFIKGLKNKINEK